MNGRGVPLYLVDAFANGPFTGNPAGVCLLDGPADTAWMQRVATELHQAATAFVGPAAGGVRPLRWFTPTSELTLCGHGTLAAAHVLWERGEHEDFLSFDSPGGPLEAERVDGRIGMRFPALPPSETEPPPGLAEVLGVETRWVGRNRLDLFVELASAEAVRELAPDLGRLQDIDARALIVTAASQDADVAFVSRCFCPRIGIPEDQATGSAHCALGPFWAGRLGADRLVGRQLSRRGAVIEVHVEGETVRLLGSAVTVVRGFLSGPQEPDPDSPAR